MNRTRQQRLVLFSLALTAFNCGTQAVDPLPPTPTPTAPAPRTVVSNNAPVDQMGGSVTTDGAVLAIPAMAVPESHTIAIVSTQWQVDGAQQLSPLYQFSPAGLKFDKLIAVTLTFDPSSAKKPAVFWTREDGSGFDNLGGTVSGNTITAYVTHFSMGVVAPDDADPQGATCGQGVLCLDGSCAATIDACAPMAPPPACPMAAPVKCDNGDCVASQAACMPRPPEGSAAACPRTASFRCPDDGRCVPSIMACHRPEMDRDGGAPMGRGDRDGGPAMGGTRTPPGMTPMMCPPQEPVRCPNGGCARSMDVCAMRGEMHDGGMPMPGMDGMRGRDGGMPPGMTPMMCPPQEPVRCPMGGCAKTMDVCAMRGEMRDGGMPMPGMDGMRPRDGGPPPGMTPPMCPPQEPVRCPSGGCARSMDGCPKGDGGAGMAGPRPGTTPPDGGMRR